MCLRAEAYFATCLTLDTVVWLHLCAASNCDTVVIWHKVKPLSTSRAITWLALFILDYSLSMFDLCVLEEHPLDYT